MQNASAETALEPSFPDWIKKPMKGYLKKMKSSGSSVFSSWNKRWFALEEGKLSYYRSKFSSEVAKRIDINDITSVQYCMLPDEVGDAHTIQIQTHNRSYHLQAKTRHEADAWLAGIQYQLFIATMKKQSDASTTAPATCKSESETKCNVKDCNHDCDQLKPRAPQPRDFSFLFSYCNGPATAASHARAMVTSPVSASPITCPTSPASSNSPCSPVPSPSPLSPSSPTSSSSFPSASPTAHANNASPHNERYSNTREQPVLSQVATSCSSAFVAFSSISDSTAVLSSDSHTPSPPSSAKRPSPPLRPVRHGVEAERPSSANAANLVGRGRSRRFLFRSDSNEGVRDESPVSNRLDQPRFSSLDTMSMTYSDTDEFDSCERERETQLDRFSVASAASSSSSSRPMSPASCRPVSSYSTRSSLSMSDCSGSIHGGGRNSPAMPAAPSPLTLLSRADSLRSFSPALQSAKPADITPTPSSSASRRISSAPIPKRNALFAARQDLYSALSTTRSSPQQRQQQQDQQCDIQADEDWLECDWDEPEDKPEPVHHRSPSSDFSVDISAEELLS